MRDRTETLARAALALLRREGLGALLRRLSRWLGGERRYYGGGAAVDSAPAYRRFQQAFEPDAAQLDTQRRTAPSLNVRLVVYTDAAGASLDDLQATLASLRAQTYAAWVWHVRHANPADFEALLASDERVQSEPSAGDYVVEVEAGAALAPFALYEIAALVSADPTTDAVYADEDQLSAGQERTAPLFKPDWSPEMMLSYDLFGGLCVFRQGLVDDFSDLHYRVAESARRVAHIPAILVHRRKARAAADEGAVTRHLTRMGIVNPVVSDHAARWTPPKTRRVSVIIPSRDQAAMLRVCLSGLFEQTDYPVFEVIVVDTGSTEAATAALYQQYAAQPRFRVVECPGAFNFSRACNVGAAAASGDLLLFLNNDVEIRHADWLERMAQWFDLPGVGVVGAKLLYPNQRLQHAGIVVGLNGLAAHLFQGASDHADSIFGSVDWYRNLLAVTGACLMIAQEVFAQIGGFDEGFVLSYSDVELCLRAVALGYRVVYTPDAQLIHHESRSRGRRVPRGDFVRADQLWRRWLEGIDPYFNPNLTHRSTFPRVRTSADDSARASNQELMRRLPDKPILTVPDDLV